MKGDELITYVRQFIELEDTVIIKLTDFLDHILENSVVDASFKQEIRSQLGILVTDGHKHARLVKDMEKYILESGRNEF